ncbi:MAG: DUF1552 domain-containing protein [Deltaproteobacteria bacterium]|nr:DUF1552 domain-containing protein [Deltaproteobacteria bacterium]
MTSDSPPPGTTEQTTGDGTAAVDSTGDTTQGSDPTDTEQGSTGEPDEVHDHIVFVYTGHGTRPPLWLPTGGENDFVLSPILAPLEPFHDRMLVLSGIDNTAGPGYDSSLSPTMGAPSLLTGGWVTEDPQTCLATAIGPSIDHVLGEALGSTMPLGLLRTGVLSGLEIPGPCPSGAGGLTSRLTFGENGIPIEVDDDASGVFDWVGQHVDPNDPELAELAELVSPPPNPSTEFLDYAALQLRLAHFALSRDVAPVATVSLGTMALQVVFPGQATTVFEMAHTNGDDATYVDVHSQLSQLVADMAQRFDDTPYGTGTLLDHTIIVWLSETGSTQAHSSQNIPVVIVGNASGRLRNGAFLDLDDAVQADLMLTLAEALGVPLPGFGDPTLQAELLDELLVR